MLIMIDNYDSFTYNIVQYLGELGVEVEVYRNDEISIEEIKEKSPSHLVISPGHVIQIKQVFLYQQLMSFQENFLSWVSV